MDCIVVHIYSSSTGKETLGSTRAHDEEEEGITVVTSACGVSGVTEAAWIPNKPWSWR